MDQYLSTKGRSLRVKPSQGPLLRHMDPWLVLLIGGTSVGNITHRSQGGNTNSHWTQEHEGRCPQRWWGKTKEAI